MKTTQELARELAELLSLLDSINAVKAGVSPRVVLTPGELLENLVAIPAYLCSDLIFQIGQSIKGNIVVLKKQLQEALAKEEV